MCRPKEVPMGKWIVMFLVLSCTVFAASKNLEIYVIDVEGGNATLFVSPSGESLLIDTGNAGAAAPRDAGRIAAAVKDAGLQQIDHLIITHWHGDHRSEEHTSELQSRFDLVCRLLLEKKNNKT